MRRRNHADRCTHCPSDGTPSVVATNNRYQPGGANADSPGSSRSTVSSVVSCSGRSTSRCSLSDECVVAGQSGPWRPVRHRSVRREGRRPVVGGVLTMRGVHRKQHQLELTVAVHVCEGAVGALVLPEVPVGHPLPRSPPSGHPTIGIEVPPDTHVSGVGPFRRVHHEHHDIEGAAAVQIPERDPATRVLPELPVGHLLPRPPPTGHRARRIDPSADPIPAGIVPRRGIDHEHDQIGHPVAVEVADRHTTIDVGLREPIGDRPEVRVHDAPHQHRGVAVGRSMRTRRYPPERRNQAGFEAPDHPPVVPNLRRLGRPHCPWRSRSGDWHLKLDVGQRPIAEGQHRASPAYALWRITPTRPITGRVRIGRVRFLPYAALLVVSGHDPLARRRHQPDSRGGDHIYWRLAGSRPSTTSTKTA